MLLNLRVQPGNGDVASDGSGMVLPTIQVVAQAEVRWLMCIIYYDYIRYFYLSWWLYDMHDYHDYIYSKFII